jgi:hypothetical protein
MKTINLLTAVAFAFFLVSASSFADEHAKCCVKAQEAGKECTHDCCVEARKNNTVCEKCGGKKDPKKPS